MDRKLEQLTRQIEREARCLAALPIPLPRPEFIANLKAAVRTEAAHFRPSPAGIFMLRRWAAVAAAILLAVGLSGVIPGSIRSGEQLVDAAELLATYDYAVRTSSDRMSFLLAEGWLLEDSSAESGDSLDRLLNSLDTSFEEIGAF